MGKKLYHPTAEGGIAFKSTRQPWEVRIPAWVYDLWMPLVGADAMGVYALYCRLEMNDGVRKITMRDIARAARIGDKRLGAINTTLQDCGFITVNKPEGAKRLMHWTTEIIVHDPPQDIAAATIQKYRHPQGYTPVSKWLVGEAPETPPSVSDDTNQCDGNQPCSVSNIEPLEVVGSLETTTMQHLTSDIRHPLSPVADAPDGAGGGGVDLKTEAEAYLYRCGVKAKSKRRTLAARLTLAQIEQAWTALVALNAQRRAKGLVELGGGHFADTLEALASAPADTTAPAAALPKKPTAPWADEDAYARMSGEERDAAGEVYRADLRRYDLAIARAAQ